MYIYEQDRNERVQELYLLQRAAQKINSILDLDTLLEEIINDVVETFGYVRSGILLKDDNENELVIAAVKGWTSDYHIKGDRIPIGENGMVGYTALTGKTYYAPDVNKDPYYVVCEESTKSELDIPLINKGKLIGVFCIQHHQVDAFKPERIQLLEGLAHHIEIAIENARLFHKERLERKRMSDELNEARQIQLNLFPKKSPVVPGFKISGECLPCREVGGDWFDFIAFDDGRLGIILADISGKGMGAALLMSSTRSILRIIAKSTISPKDVLKQVNDILLNDFQINNKFVTMIYGILDPKNKTLTFANAGHLYPLFINNSGSNFLENTAGIPLGVTQGLFNESTVEFTPGSRLIFYSDGVTESANKSSEEFGTERLKKHFLKETVSIPSLIEDVSKFSGENSYCDDLTIVMIEAE